ncbi:hypothetical protein [Sinomonas sp. R1AF57]|jgi:hypothetical protein|uniref:hypothetical protein n=1 Tax=Sinomonas sp. R1AF57 TaxID=2020377 RepID=UPI000B5F7CD7|nr:hypothetical protein [Sinomonas sp. R1AF57]ASN51084.1 hypothetical protein CGQ25_02525 [Sinomonas sp. R1AF57]
MDIRDYLDGDQVDLHGFQDHLDSLDDEARVGAVRSLGPAQQALLFEAAADAALTDTAHLVPAGTPAWQAVVHAGRNSLPLLSRFEKRFFRTELGEVFGYNRHVLRPLVGPGYFGVARTERGFLVIDYARLPARAPRGWPAVRANSARLGRFVYHRTTDTLRAVGAHVTVGRASRDGRALDAWFVLCRRTPDA